MRIANNIMALNAHRQLTINQGGAAKAIEKLSSGFRINRAGDDAAGLAISEKMRGQIRGLNQAIRNAQDGISLIQTAEGALTESHAILQRMRELAVQSASDTNTEDDRSEIQKEIDQLAEELTRIASTTEFNTKKLLNGELNVKFHIGANQGQNVSLSISDMSAEALKVAGAGGAGLSVDGTGSIENLNTPLAINPGPHTLTVVKFDSALNVDGDNANYGLADSDGNIVAVSEDGDTYTFLQQATAIDDLELSGARATWDDGSGNSGTIDVAFNGGHAVTSGTVAVVRHDGDQQITISGTAELTVVVEDHGLAPGKYTVVDDGGGTVELRNEAGEKVADVVGNEIQLYGVAIITAAAFQDGDVLEIQAKGGLDVRSQETADKAITIIDQAIAAVSAERSKLGALQNRLEHTIANLGTSAENLQAAESRIRDVDMAKEMMEFTKYQILQQASTAMLAQANLAPQSVLQLLG